MSLAGFKKQLNKANQFVSEKIGGVKGTELDDDFVEMERKVDVTSKLVDEIIARTHELLQPNPASRARLSAVNSMAKLRGTAKNSLYPQPEGQLGECMCKYGKELGEETVFGSSLVETGEAYRQMSDIKYAVEDNVKQNFIEPLHYLQTKDLKEVNHHRKKMSGRRLDFDCKKRKQVKGTQGGGHVSEEEINMAEEKFEESKQLAETAMFNLLENDAEQVSQLTAFIEAELNYHRQAVDILAACYETLQEKCSEASSRPKKEFLPKRISSQRFNKSPMHENNHSDEYSLSPGQPTYPKSGASTPASSSSWQDLSGPSDAAWGATTPTSVSSGQVGGGGGGGQPCAEALYDFEPENEGELGFKEGDMINLLARIDDNWYEGSLHGQTGFFPVNYVKVVVPVA